MGCWWTKEKCEREIYGEIVDSETGEVKRQYCFLHRPAVKDGRTKYIARLVEKKES